MGEDLSSVIPLIDKGLFSLVEPCFLAMTDPSWGAGARHARVEVVTYTCLIHNFVCFEA